MGCSTTKQAVQENQPKPVDEEVKEKSIRKSMAVDLINL
jgi:hypothetical protein